MEGGLQNLLEGTNKCDRLRSVLVQPRMSVQNPFWPVRMCANGASLGPRWREELVNGRHARDEDLLFKPLCRSRLSLFGLSFLL